jgi:hypothetical protein
MAVQRLLPNDQDLMTDERARELSLYLPPGWLDVYGDSEGHGRRTLCRRLLELYRESLKGLGYSYVYASRAFRTDTGVPLYYIIWAGKNETGAKIAEHVILKQFAPQSIRLFSADEDDWIG